MSSEISLVPRLPVFFLIITDNLYYSAINGGNKDAYNSRKNWEPGLQSHVTDVKSRRVIDG